MIVSEKLVGLPIRAVLESGHETNYPALDWHLSFSAKVDGRKVREALETKNPNVAKLKRDDRLKASRAAAKKEQAKTVGDLLAFDLRRVSSRSA